MSPASYLTMRIRSVRVENFRAIRLLELSDLPNAVVVAGPNGCGKSSLFDALRLLKSAYGQYTQNEYKSWFSEFQIDINRIRQETRRVLHDPTKPLRIRAEFELADAERNYLREHARELYLRMKWAQRPGVRTMDGEVVVVNPALRRTEAPIVESQANELLKALLPELDRQSHTAELTMVPGSDPVAAVSPVVELMFSVYRPNDLGVIDYHSPNRFYSREQVGGINLRIEDTRQEQGGRALYNTNQKYGGVKTEMAQAFVRQLLAEKFGASIPSETGLKDTLDELFQVFFPGKTFLGPQPTRDGGLAFPVRLEGGHEHDINELSSGEKEVLLGYLRLRDSAPKNSIVLLDEPELHLNPRLIRGLPRFYQKHLGEALGNQLWLITHSDALLRESVDEPAYAVYHMRTAYTTDESENQLAPIAATSDVERVILDLVGDLATYSPRSKVVFVEGEDSDFDENMIRELFPEFAERVNLISVGPKSKVMRLHHLMDKAAKGGKLDARFYSIVDRDFDGPVTAAGDHGYRWDVYHIENYLLEPHFIRVAMNGLALGEALPSEGEIEAVLRSCAEETIDELVRIQMDRLVNDELVTCIKLGYDRQKLPASQGLRDAAERSMHRMQVKLQGILDKAALEAREASLREQLRSHLEDGTWRKEFRGRAVLRSFVHRYDDVLSVPYEKFRNLIINRMREALHKPAGMMSVITAVLEQ